MSKITSGLYGDDSHFPHQAAYSLGADNEVQRDQIQYRTQYATSRIISMNPVNLFHDRLVVRALSLRLIIIRPFAQRQNFKLLVQRQFDVLGH